MKEIRSVSRHWHQSRALPTIGYALAGLALVLLAGCDEGQSTMNTLVPHSDLTRQISDIYGRIFWWTLLLFIGVQGMLLYAVLKFRERGGEKGNPEQVHGNLRLEITWTILPVFILLHIAIPTVSFIFRSQADATPAEDAIEINALGMQWWFAFEYPDLGVTTANEIHVPLGRTIEVRLQSDNVIHAFWVPQIAAKRDMMPGRVNHIKFKAEKVGTYLGQCAEYCGDSHAFMRFELVVDTPEDFEKWVARQKEPADVTTAEAKAALPIIEGQCSACHTLRGTIAAQKTAPDLTHIASRGRIASGILENTPENLKRWITSSRSIKPGSKMTDGAKIDESATMNLSSEQIDTVVAWLGTLK